MSQAELLAPSPVVPSFPPLSYQGVPVLTTEMLAQAYEVEAKQIRQNFANNRERFIEGKHFFLLSGNDLREFKNYVENFDLVHLDKRARHFTLWTERGAARNAKMLDSDRAWDVFELLEETFFRVVRPDPIPTPDDFTGTLSITPSTTEDRKPLRALVGTWAQVSGLPFAACWTQLKAAFRLSDIRDLPQEWIPDALAWVQGKIDSIHSGNFREIPEIPSSMQRRMQDMHDFEKRFCDFAYETRSQFSEIEREYRMLTHGVFPDMLRMVPAIDQSAIRRLTDALESQSYSAYQMINDGLSIMRMSIISAKAAIRTLKNMD